MGDHQMGDAVAEQGGETRQERRERKLTARRERMQVHGARFAQAYANAVRRRADRGERPPAGSSGTSGG